METLILAGKLALSEFRMQNLLQAWKNENTKSGISKIRAVFIYLLDLKEDLKEEEKIKIKSLLNADKEVFDFSAGEFLVLPRKGTISPWSSKATDIFESCGLTAVSRVEKGILYQLLDNDGKILPFQEVKTFLPLLHDRMIEGVYQDIDGVFEHGTPSPLTKINLMSEGISALRQANQEMGLALSEEEIQYLSEVYTNLKRAPTDVELMMFGQVNSEHCRHKIFNAKWIIDGTPRDMSLFQMIRNTHQSNPKGTLLAYKDNAAILEGFDNSWFEAEPATGLYQKKPQQVDIVIKVETHNHPTAISPYPGAATGVGGEIRDEAATGIGGKSKAGLCAYIVSNLMVPGFVMPWEEERSFPGHLATPLEIMLEAPIGGARFGNEFGRPGLLGIFKTFQRDIFKQSFGYHKPIMAAGGMGNIKREHTQKHRIPDGAPLIQLGGPALRIGLGGGAASSMDAGTNELHLDYNSVQRDNAEMQRRCQEVINACIALGEDNPILSIHDVGAGGLSNAFPELVAENGAVFDIRKIHNQEITMSPMEIWCCEAQERYVLALNPAALECFLQICQRERCPVAVVGTSKNDGMLILKDPFFQNKPIDISLQTILGNPPKMLRNVVHEPQGLYPSLPNSFTVKEALERVLRLPAVANKTFLITITDRTVTGMVTRDQMTGPYQTPVSDSAVTVSSFDGYSGEAMAMGERVNMAPHSAPASGRMAIGEALTNIVSAYCGSITNVKLSANWMCACGEPGEDANLFDTVYSVGMELCPRLGISIPVGKDSLSMKTVWKSKEDQTEKVKSPLSLIVSSFSPVLDVRKTVTPDLKPLKEGLLLYIDLGKKQNRLGGSSLEQAYNAVYAPFPDLDDPVLFKNFFEGIQELIGSDLISAYHDRSDGGLIVTLLEMCFSGRKGIQIELDDLGTDPLSILFSEELGCVIQIEKENKERVLKVIEKHELSEICYEIGISNDSKEISVIFKNNEVLKSSVTDLNRIWSELTFKMQSLRDNPKSAKQEYDLILDEKDPGIKFHLSFDPTPFSIPSSRPRVAVLREQGVNGHMEMAAAFHEAGFDSVDVHMSDLLNRKKDLKDFQGLVACGGFSYGDVLGAGTGWSSSILWNSMLKEMFHTFFHRLDTFALGVCNGCQMLSQLKEIIPGTESWPLFKKNVSEQFEARLVMVEIKNSPSIFFKEMEGSRLAIPVAHGEGYADFGSGSFKNAEELICVRYVDHYGKPTEIYPRNPNGSPEGITGLTSIDGKVTILMPHPERVFRNIQLSYSSGLKGDKSPWFRMFQNARAFIK